MDKKSKPARPTLGVLAGWHVYEEGMLPNSYLASVLKWLNVAARDQACNLLLACGLSTLGEDQNPAWPTFGSESNFVPVGPWNTDGLIVILPLLSESRSDYIRQIRAEGHPVVFIGAGEGGPAVISDRRLLAGGVAFTAILASNDESAIGAMPALRQAGRRIPQDVAVIGFEDAPATVAQTPPLSSIYNPTFELAAIAALAEALPALLESSGRSDRRQFAESLLYQAQVTVTESVHRQYSRVVNQKLAIADRVNILTSRFLGILDQEKILSLLAEYLPDAGIAHAEVVFFEGEGGASNPKRATWALKRRNASTPCR